ncbi:MAG: hypothetical protein ACRBBR_06545 [Cellvibrionaceae bacterium]
MTIDRHKIEFYRRYFVHYCAMIARSAQDDETIIDLINGKGESEIYSELQKVIDVDWRYFYGRRE